MFPIICTICRALNIPGLEDFSGASFHTSEWKKDFVATGKRIAVIGTGASAVQVVPALAEQQPSNLTVFQRWEALNALFFNPQPPASPFVQNRNEKKVKSQSEALWEGNIIEQQFWLARCHFSFRYWTGGGGWQLVVSKTIFELVSSKNYPSITRVLRVLSEYSVRLRVSGTEKTSEFSLPEITLLE